jgi:hypothetical protein
MLYLTRPAGLAVQDVTWRVMAFDADPADAAVEGIFRDRSGSDQTRPADERHGGAGFEDAGGYAQASPSPGDERRSGGERSPAVRRERVLSQAKGAPTQQTQRYKGTAAEEMHPVEGLAQADIPAVGSVESRQDGGPDTFEIQGGPITVAQVGTEINQGYCPEEIYERRSLYRESGTEYDRLYLASIGCNPDEFMPTEGIGP